MLTFTWLKLAETLGMLATALAAIYGFVKLIYKPLINLFTGAVSFYHNCNYVAKEMKPNGGTSLKDSVEGLKHSIDAILSTVIRLDQRQIAIANHSDKGIFESDVNGDNIFVNRAYCRIFGRTIDEALGKGWKLFIHPDDRDKVVEDWYACVKERRDFVMAFKILKSDSTSHLVDVHAYVLRDLKGMAIGYMGFVTPIETKEEASLT
ncbi:hypothetical protein CCP3SC5AM1_880010 [Gammaproteobacteria bacterium]